LTLPDGDDRHVLAAAITARASVIVTFNVRDFPADVLQLHGIQATHPDEFILDVESLDSLAVIKAARGDLRDYSNQSLTEEAYVDDLRRAGVSKTADLLGRFKVLLEGDQTDSNP